MRYSDGHLAAVTSAFGLLPVMRTSPDGWIEGQCWFKRVGRRRANKVLEE
jgi:hypothetical protein